MKTIEDNFLGRGWTFPPQFIKSSNPDNPIAAEMSSDVKDINESLRILLGTIIGERIMNATYGCNLDDLIFEPISNTLISRISERVRVAIIHHEPRIKLENLNVYSSELEGTINLVVDYIVNATNTRNNLVYPFYLTEANNI